MVADVAEMRRNLHAEATTIRAVVHALAERVARIEGAMAARCAYPEAPFSLHDLAEREGARGPTR